MHTKIAHPNRINLAFRSSIQWNKTTNKITNNVEVINVDKTCERIIADIPKAKYGQSFLLSKNTA